VGINNNNIMKTYKTEQLPGIEWERGELIDTFDHEKHYAANGVSYDGKLWSGTWIVTDGEHDQIKDIEAVYDAESHAWELIQRVRNVGADHVKQYNFSMETVKTTTGIALKMDINFALLLVDFAEENGAEMQEVRNYLIALKNDLIIKEAEQKAADYKKWLAEFERTRPGVCPHNNDL
jgi:hypothetical protein